MTIAIVSAQQHIWQLPWHFWHIFEHYPHAIEVFSKPRFSNVSDRQPQCNGRVNIFGLFGRAPRLEPERGSLDPIVNRDALALDLIVRSRDPHQRLSLFSPWRNGMKLAWMLLWSVLKVCL